MKRVLCSALMLATGLAAAAGPEGSAPGRAAVDYWITGYHGEDLTSGKFSCPPPAIPPVSKTNGDIKAVSAAIATWQTCYNGFAANLNAVPAGQRIPPEVAKQMTPEELAAARAHVHGVYRQVIANARAAAADIVGKSQQWRSATKQYVEAQNKLDAEDRKKDYDRMVEQDTRDRRWQERSPSYATPTPSPSGPPQRH